MRYTSIDKRTAFYKQHQDLITDFEKLSSEVLSKYILDKIPMPKEDAIYFADICDRNYSLILNELDKLQRIQNIEGIKDSEILDYALKNGLIYIKPQDVIFDFIGAVCRRDKHLAADLLEDLKENKEPDLVILSLLYTNFRSMLLIKSTNNSSDLSKSTGLTGFQIKMAKEYGNNYSPRELLHNLKIIRWAEKGIKVGKIETELSVDYVLANIL